MLDRLPSPSRASPVTVHSKVTLALFSPGTSPRQKPRMREFSSQSAPKSRYSLPAASVTTADPAT